VELLVFYLASSTKSDNGQDGGIRLSYATLGAFMKYPKESLPKKPTQHVADKKYGFFQQDKNIFLDVAQDLGLKQTRTGKTVCTYGQCT
jgi:dGTPase